MIHNLINLIKDNKESLPLILSIIGCITGCASLLINFYKFLSERTKVKIECKAGWNIFLEKLPEYHTYDTKYQGFLSIRIINKSTLPVTFYALDVMHDFKKLPSDNYCNATFDFISEKTPSTMIVSRKTVQPSYIFPLKIEPFGVFQGYVFLSSFPDTNKEKLYLLIKLYSSRKNFYRLCSIHKLKTQVYDSDEEYNLTQQCQK